MRFVDNSEITVTGGHGGSGSASFRHEKYTPKGGPDGGDGGAGGNIFIQGTNNLQSLMDLNLKRTYKARGGEGGSTNKKHGTKGPDCNIPVPFGTMIFNENEEMVFDITPETPTFVAAKGGKGGKGNTHFATARHQAPRYAQPGLPGEHQVLKLELRLIAEVGLVGLPNAGKSTLLKTLTKASPKIADYPFTTLYPNLGNLKYHNREILIADIPGLIKGASKGTGLGHEFLRHIDRTKVLIHLIPCQETVQDTFSMFKIIQNELSESEYHLNQKETIYLLTKTDLILPEVEEETMRFFETKGFPLLPISAFTLKNIDTLMELLYSHKSLQS